MSTTLDRDDSAGRAKHLGGLAQVFRHRHASWRDFGRFLKREFRDSSPQGGMGATPSGLSVMTCRHGPGGSHHQPLANALSSPAYAASLNHERFRRPCVSHGAYEKGKNGGLVVADLCGRAARFLDEIGRGDPAELTRRDFTYDPGSTIPSSPLIGSSQDSNASGDRMVVDDASQEAVEDVTLTPALFDFLGRPGDGASDEGGFFEDEDVREESVVYADTAVSSTVSMSDLPESEDSAFQYSARQSSTKMRAATLAYLWGFADDPGALRREFRRLRSDSTAHVLHLCGCGMSFVDSSDRKVAGCAERSHLKLGSSEENDAHRIWHQSFCLGNPARYGEALMNAHQGQFGQGLF